MKLLAIFILFVGSQLAYGAESKEPVARCLDVEEITAIQTFLGVRVDGELGPITGRAIAAWNRQKGISHNFISENLLAEAKSDYDIMATKKTSLAELAGDLTDMLGLISDRERKLEQLEKSIMEKDLKPAPSPNDAVIESLRKELELADQEILISPVAY